MKKFFITNAILMITAMNVFAAGELILNEFNAVGSEKYLKTDTYDGSTNVDVYFQEMADGLHPDKMTGTLLNGRIQGNGGDWIELVVTQDHLDIRGWQIRWAETDTAKANEADGTDIWYGNGNVEQGILQFANNSVWSNLRAGTIITIVDESYIYVDKDNQNRTYNVSPSYAEAVINLSTDTSFNPEANDWWINVSTKTEASSSTPLLTCVQNVMDHTSYDWGCGNDAWQAQINDAQGNLVWGPVGENLGTTYWGGGGINSAEVGKLTANPSASVSGANFSDADTSSFGLPNRWNDQLMVQDFSAIRAWYNPPADCAAAIAMGFKNYFDVNNDCYVNFKDFAQFAQNWMDCVNPNDSTCSEP
ncbi:MAG: hypothetical protein A2Y12_07790 [Planctomycetes bacterium GWF2_42_9]|nr:MAG: hypothetical protein A2Y12_07790 [Planctomycetes bacterium GWF2_42_9]